MKRFGLALIALVATTSIASAWNDKGHMVVARLAWKELNAKERARIVKFLENHPHHQTFLRENRPAGFTRDEWVFLRAATWADWVRGGDADRRKFNRPKHHFINTPFIQPKSDVMPPEVDKENVIQAIKDNLSQAKTGGDRVKRAVALTWLFHLVGDIHQPLHCITLFGDEFPQGDRGGTRALLRVDGRVIQMHRFWDGLLGRPTTPTSITNTVDEVQKMVKANPDALKEDLAANKTPESWAKESYAIGKRIAYRNGDIRPANNDDHPVGDAIQAAPEGYAEQAGETARYCVAKAGKRLAQVLREVIAANE